MVSAFIPAGVEGDKARAQQEVFSNPCGSGSRARSIDIDDAIFLSSVASLSTETSPDRTRSCTDALSTTIRPQQPECASCTATNWSG